MTNEELRKAAYAYVAALIVYDAVVFEENPELTTEIVKIRDALRIASRVPSTEDLQVPF